MTTKPNVHVTRTAAKTEHTPGPWRWSREKIGDTWHCFLRGQPNHLNDRLVTAMREDLAAFPYAADTANAKLIAAAPELVECLRELCQAEEWYGDPDNVAVNKVWAKATALLQRIEE